MPSFSDLSSASGLAELNTHLSTRSYIDGFKPSAADASLLSSIAASVDGSQYPHVYRWLNHITSFPASIRSSWGGKASTVSSSSSSSSSSGKEEKKKAAKKPKDDDDFLSALSDDEDEEEDEDDDAAESKARSAAEAKEKEDEEARKEKARAAGKKAAKSTLILDIKPEDDETNLDNLEASIRKECVPEGLLWGECQRIPIAFGIKKLRMIAVVIDDLVSTDDLQESIEALDGVQSTDIHAFNKI